jgi:hypothetical protein
MLVLTVLFFMWLRVAQNSILENNMETEDTASVSTLVKSAYSLATECFLRFTSLNDGEIQFTNRNPTTVSNPSLFLEEVVDDTLLNFTVFEGKDITKEKAYPELQLKENEAILKLQQDFTIKVNNKQYRVDEFITRIPTKMKQFIEERDDLLLGEDLELNKLYGKDAKIYGNKGHSIIELNKDKEKFLFVR